MDIITNNVPRDVIYGCELTPKERAEFDYIPPEDFDYHSFMRYRGEVYDLSEFIETPWAGNWDAFQSDSYFSGIAIRYVENYERVIAATIIA